MSARTRDEIRSRDLRRAGRDRARDRSGRDRCPAQPLREQIDLDSFDFLNVIIRLHEILGIDIPESDYAELATLDGAVDYLARRSGAG